LITRKQDAEKAKEIEDWLDGVEQSGVQARVFRFDW
jgi:hypothetical protein